MSRITVTSPCLVREKNKTHLASVSGGWDSGALAISIFSAHSFPRTESDKHTRTPGILKLIRRRLRPFVTAAPKIRRDSTRPTVRLARGKSGSPWCRQRRNVGAPSFSRTLRKGWAMGIIGALKSAVSGAATTEPSPATSDRHSPQGDDELDAVNVLALEPFVIGDEKIHVRAGGAGQLNGVGRFK